MPQLELSKSLYFALPMLAFRQLFVIYYRKRSHLVAYILYQLASTVRSRMLANTIGQTGVLF